MLTKRAFRPHSLKCRRYISTTAAATSNIRSIPLLPSSSLETFRTSAFNSATPALLPRETFLDLPAIQKWFLSGPSDSTKTIAPITTTTLNATYLSRFGSTIVPLEFTNTDPATQTTHFTRTEQSLSFFLECVNASTSHYLPRPTKYFTAYVPGARPSPKQKKKQQHHDPTKIKTPFFTPTAPLQPLTPPTSKPKTGIYLAQAPLSDLPHTLQNDLPTPHLVLQAGKGDIYSSSIWLGAAPTYTPLHRDPNPNLFVQLAGRKRVRLCAPEVGRSVFARVRERVASEGAASGAGGERLRGAEMMEGVERRVLEEEVWGGDGEVREWWGSLWEAEVGVGDALFIPLGWWHSVRSVGEGMTGSVNWWFR